MNEKKCHKIILQFIYYPTSAGGCFPCYGLNLLRFLRLIHKKLLKFITMIHHNSNDGELEMLTMKRLEKSVNLIFERKDSQLFTQKSKVQFNIYQVLLNYHSLLMSKVNFVLTFFFVKKNSEMFFICHEIQTLHSTDFGVRSFKM